MNDMNDIWDLKSMWNPEVRLRVTCRCPVCYGRKKDPRYQDDWHCFDAFLTAWQHDNPAPLVSEQAGAILTWFHAKDAAEKEWWRQRRNQYHSEQWIGDRPPRDAPCQTCKQQGRIEVDLSIDDLTMLLREKGARE